MPNEEKPCALSGRQGDKAMFPFLLERGHSVPMSECVVPQRPPTRKRPALRRCQASSRDSGVRGEHPLNTLPEEGSERSPVPVGALPRQHCAPRFALSRAVEGVCSPPKQQGQCAGLGQLSCGPHPSLGLTVTPEGGALLGQGTPVDAPHVRALLPFFCSGPPESPIF